MTTSESTEPPEEAAASRSKTSGGGLAKMVLAPKSWGPVKVNLQKLWILASLLGAAR